MKRWYVRGIGQERYMHFKVCETGQEAIDEFKGKYPKNELRLEAVQDSAMDRWIEERSKR